ncbi:MAG: DUF2937 family protein [Alcanivoracaceae bacterium]|nr:DUF2937 family protein [Alcanivoracaceae bacterium]
MIFKHLLDKIFFTLGVIVFLQLPHFIDQYTQRIGGYAESKQQQLNDYQLIADNNFNGNLNLLVSGFMKSGDPAVRQAGNNIKETQFDVKVLSNEISFLEEEELLRKVVFLTTNIRMNIAKGTLGAFQPGIPLNLWSMIYGLIGGILFSLIFNGTAKVPKLLFKKKKRTSIYTN